MELRTYRLGELCQRLSSGKAITAADIKEEGKYLVYGANGSRGYTDSYNFDGACAVIGRQGAYCGNVKYVEGQVYMSEHAVVAQANIHNDSKYLAYKLGILQLGRFSGQAAQPGLSVQRLSRLLIEIPSKEIQQKIANILSRYDEAIENNNKRIKLLEQMAQNLYKEWFVRFRFPGYENCEFENGIPVGWHQGRLFELLDFKRGKNITADEMEDGVVPVISAGLEPSGYHNTSNVQGVSLTISSSGANAGYLSIHYEDIWAADCMFITEKNTKNIYYLYELLNNIRPVILNQQRGAAQPHIYSKDINNLRLWIPNEELRENANRLFETFHKEIYQLQRANKNLAKQRDLLLPRLMSGKLEVE